MIDRPVRLPRLLVAVSAAGLLFVTYYAAVLLVHPGDAYLRFHTNVMYNLPALLALAVAPVAIRRSAGRERVGWICLALTLACWQVGDWAYAYYAYVLERDVPFPGWPDITYYAGYISYVAAIPLLAIPRHRLRDSRWLIDAAIVITVGGALAWHLLMEPLVNAGEATPFSVAVSLGYPLLDLAIFAALVGSFFAGDRRLSGRVALLAVAALVQVVVDGWYSYEIEAGTYADFGDPIDLGWVAAYGMLAICFVLPAEPPSEASARRYSQLGVALPYVALLPLPLLLTGDAASSPGVIGPIVLAVALVVLRQLFTLRENVLLLRRVEAEASSRKAILEAQSDLGEVLIVFDGRRVVSANGALTAITGYTLDELKALPDLLEVFEPDERASLVAWIRGRFGGDAAGRNHETRIHRRDGGSAIIEIAATRLSDDAGSRLLFIGRDVTARKRDEQELARSRVELEDKSRRLEAALVTEREQSRRDALTGALNHGALVDELRGIVDAGAQAAVVMLDIDGMKATNDMFGHQAGDHVLVGVARAISRDGAIVGRYGGDEFIALLPGARQEQADAYVSAISAAFREIAVRDPSSASRVPVEVSIGVSLFPEEAATAAALVDFSDGAMYAAKRKRPTGGKATPQPMRDERAARMVGDLVALLTSGGTLTDKLRHVVRRLSAGAGYDLVSLSLPGIDGGACTFCDGEWSAVAADARDVPADRAVIFDGAHAEDFLTARGMQSAVVAPMSVDGRVIGTITAASRREGVFGPADAAFLMSVATQVTAIVRMAQLVEELSAATASLEESRAETVIMLAIAAEAHDRSTGMHLASIRSLAEALARELAWPEADVAELGLAAVLHDIGKLSIPEAVLSSAGALGDEDWALMKRHTIWGSHFLAGRRGFALAASVARSHHERWDGGGYPDGLAAEDIPQAAAIVTVADSFDAMTHDRPYRAGRALGDAIEEIKRCSGTQFSPRVVEALLRLHYRGETAHFIAHDEHPAADAA